MAQHVTVWNQPVATSIAFETATRTASANFPSGAVVPAGHAAHHDAVRFDVQHRVVAAQSTQKLTQAAMRRHSGASNRNGRAKRVAEEFAERLTKSSSAATSRDGSRGEIG